MVKMNSHNRNFSQNCENQITKICGYYHLCTTIVYFGKYAGTEAGDNYLILREDEVLGVVDKA